MRVEATDRDGHAFGLERVCDHLAEQFRAGRCVIRGLDDDAVPRRQHLDERPDAEVEGEVPRNDRTDDPLGLVTHRRASRAEQRRIGVAFFVRHPSLEAAHRVLRATRHSEHFHEVARGRRMRSEIGHKRLRDPRTVTHHHAG